MMLKKNINKKYINLFRLINIYLSKGDFFVMIKGNNPLYFNSFLLEFTIQFILGLIVCLRFIRQYDTISTEDHDYIYAKLVGVH